MEWVNGILPLLLLAWGMVVKHVPKLASFPNAAIPYLNAVLAILAKLAIPDAHADSTLVAGTAIAAKATFWSVLLAGIVDSVKATLLYEVFVRHPADRAGLKKAVPR